MNIPEQKVPVFAGQSYKIGVEQNGKTYTYILYDDETILERWSGDKSPISMNKNSAFINDSVIVTYPESTQRIIVPPFFVT